MYQKDLALNNLKGLTCHKSQPNNLTKITATLQRKKKDKRRKGKKKEIVWLVCLMAYQPSWVI